MSLSYDTISQFVKITNDKKETTKKETITYGTVVAGDKVILDGTLPDTNGNKSAVPAKFTVSAETGDRVVVMIRNHSVVVTANLQTPSTTEEKAGKIATDKIAEANFVKAERVDTLELAVQQARADNLTAHEIFVLDIEALKGRIDNLDVENLEAAMAKIENLDATYAKIDDLETNYATIDELNTKTADISKITGIEADIRDIEAANVEISGALEAAAGDIKTLQTEKLDATSGDIRYANIDFANIGEAAIKKILADSGLIKDIIVGNGTITGKLVGVTISGDLIEGNTIVAEKLVVKGEDGLYYKLNTNGVTTEAEQTDYNSLNGSVIKAKSITATKISVDDLVAFDATIGGFNITTESLYSGTKESVNNTTRGIYLDKTGQVNIGDGSNFIKYYKDQNGNYKLAISAESIIFATTKKSVEETINDIQVGGRNLLKNSRNIQLISNNKDKYPVNKEVIKDNDREFTRYFRTEHDLSPTVMSLYSTIPLDSIMEKLTGQEMTFSFLMRCSHETTATTMNNIVIEGTNFIWASNTAKHNIATDWKRVFVTATITHDYERVSSNVLRFNPSNIVIPDGEIANFYIDVCEWKIEKGNKATDWTPAPEDLASSDELSTVQTKVDEANAKAIEAETLIAQLKDNISMLVTDGNGTSLMTQTDTGWTFSTAEIQTIVNTTSEGLADLIKEMGDTNSAVDILQQAVNDLGTIAEYVKIGVYEDEPCIELGEGDSDFKLRITNTRMMFTEGSAVLAYFNNQSFHVKKAVVEEELQQGGFVWKARSNGNLGLVWKGGNK